jgi:ABC-type antimicrobial peptide transport system permease subunit
LQFVKSQLYEMTTVSPAVLAAAIATLLFAAFIAALIPGRRAATIDPAMALRSE